MRLIQAIWAKWHARRMFCGYCGAVPVEQPGGYCSELCEDYAILENSAA